MSTSAQDTRGEMDRRTLLKLAGGAAAGGGAVAAGIYYTSEPAIAASGLTAEDVSVESAEGELQELTIAPTVTVRWENYSGVQTVGVRFRTDGPQSNGTVTEWTQRDLDEARTSGDFEFDMETANMLSRNDGPLDAGSFSAEEGEEATNDVTVMMDVRLVDGDGNTIEQQTPIMEVTYAVRVTNLESEISVSGKLNTGAECVTVEESVLDDLRCLFD
jgi:hypothetical protein